MTKDKDGMTITIGITVARRKLAQVLASAFEHGAGYWIRYGSLAIEPPSPVRYRRVFSDNMDCPLYDSPLQPGGQVTFVDDVAGCERVLDLEACERGLRLMAQAHPRHFANLMTDKDDAETGDVFLQLAVIGDLVYG